MPISPISLKELLRPRSAQQIVNDTLSYMANPPDPNLVSVRTANWRPGGPYRTLLLRQGIEASLLYQVLAAFAGSAFLRYAQGRWLDLLGEDYLDEPRQDANFSTVSLTFTVPAGAGPIGPIPLRAAAADGKEFVSLAPATLPAGPATLVVAAKAAQAGAAWNVGANTITRLVSPNVLGIAVTNPAAAVGGYDREPDQRYAQRLRAKWGALSTGSPAAAYVFWALSASKEVQRVRVYSHFNMGAYASDYVSVLLGTQVGGVSAQAVADVFASINPKLPLNAKLAVQSAVALNATVTGVAKVYATYQASAPAAISNSLQALGARIPIGSYDQGPVPLSELVDAVYYDPAQVYDVVLTGPGAPIAPTYNQLVVFTNNVTVAAV